MGELIEKLRSVKWEVTDEGDPTHKCVFVDMRPADFRDLLRKAAAALEAAREQLDWAVKENDRLLAEGSELTSRAERLEEALREDSERLDWLASECIPEGFIHVKSDIYEYACEVAGENGRDEPTNADCAAGYRRMIDAARANDILHRTASQAGGAQ